MSTLDVLKHKGNILTSSFRDTLVELYYDRAINIARRFRGSREDLEQEALLALVKYAGRVEVVTEHTEPYLIKCIVGHLLNLMRDARRRRREFADERISEYAKYDEKESELRHGKFTEFERDMLQLIEMGMTNEQIGAIFGRSGGWATNIRGYISQRVVENRQ